MNFEILKRSHVKRNIIIGVVVVLIISAVILNFTRARYRVTQSIDLVNGTINYTLPDLNIVGLYIDGAEATELDSTKTYTLDTTQSTCTYKDGTQISNLNISYDSETGNLTITPFTTKGTKCTLYFNEQVFAKDTILANYPTQTTRTNFRTTVTNTTTGTIYYADTSKGRTYYFAGNPTDNWVRWAGFYWRIIRINEDGTIRMIYQGTSANTTGTETQTQTSAFNSSYYDDNAGVGYMYQSNQVHGLASSSTIKGVLDEWYQNNLASHANDIDMNAGFCGDRTPSTSSSSINNSGGTGTTTTYYAGYVRYYGNTSLTPTFECTNDSDLYTTSGSSDGNKALQYPIGLISMDEVWYAGGYQANNTSYYLYTRQFYWTMSPYGFSYGFAHMFVVASSGALSSNRVNYTYGVRPAINLRADITISSGNGTASNPYVIAT